MPTRTYLPRVMGSTHELNEITSQWNSYKKYFDRDSEGQWILNDKGKKALEKKEVSTSRYGTIGRNDPAFYNFLKDNNLLSITYPKSSYNGGVVYPGFGNNVQIPFAPQDVIDPVQTALNRMESIANEDYDYTTSDEFYREIDESEFGKVFSILTRLAKEGKIKGSDYTKDEKGNTVFQSGATSKDLTDLTKKDISGARPVQSSYGTNYLEVDFVDGERIRIPYSSIAKHSGEVSKGFAQAAREARAENDVLSSIQLMNTSFDELINPFTTTKVKEYEYDSQKDNSTEELLLEILGD